MTVRPATAADVDAVTRLEAALFGVDAWSRDQVAEELLGEHRGAWVAGDPGGDPGDGPVVGYAVTRTVGDVADLQRIAVHPRHRRRGLAGALLAAAAPGDRRVLLEVSAANEGALAFYAAAGFVEIARRRRYYRDGSDALVLERRPVA